MVEALGPLMPWVHLTGRILFAMIFIAMGMNHLMKLDDMSAYAASKGAPSSKATTAVSGLVIVAAGIMVLLGWHRFIGAALLVIFLILTAFMMHPFWKESDPQASMNEMSHFMKDLALAGAALFIAFYAALPWPMSL
jgi:putative oxidoreductase